MKKKTTRRKGPRIQRVTSVSTFADTEKQDRAYWLRQTPQARLRAMELMRRINYGKAATGRMERVLEIVSSNGYGKSDDTHR
jgi:hypothetical protein